MTPSIWQSHGRIERPRRVSSPNLPAQMPEALPPPSPRFACETTRCGGNLVFWQARSYRVESLPPFRLTREATTGGGDVVRSQAKKHLTQHRAEPYCPRASTTRLTHEATVWGGDAVC